MNAAAAALTDERVLIDHSPPAVSAHEVSAALRRGRHRRRRPPSASRSRSTTGELTAVMGQSGLGQVDAHAHPRGPRPADARHRRIDGIEI